eukprot:3431515-Alexandrium_andersonii.AAC.1
MIDAIGSRPSVIGDRCLALRLVSGSWALGSACKRSSAVRLFGSWACYGLWSDSVRRTPRGYQW